MAKVVTEDFIDEMISPARVIEQGEGGIFRFEAVVSEADFVNRNRRMYPAEVLFPAFEALSTKLEQSPGLVDHPGVFDGPSVSNIGIRWESFHTEGKQVIGRGRIVPTQRGKDLQAAIEAGVAVGFSTRGYGVAEEVELSGQKVRKMTKFDLVTVDAVTDPSVFHARTRFFTKEENERMENELKELKAALEAAEARAVKAERELAERTASAEQASEAATASQAEIERLQARVSELEAVVAEAEATQAKAALENKLIELTSEHRFGATIRAEVKALQESGVPVTLDNIEPLVTRFRSLVEAAGAAANDSGANPRGDISTDEDAVPTPEALNTRAKLDDALDTLISG